MTKSWAEPGNEAS